MQRSLWIGFSCLVTLFCPNIIAAQPPPPTYTLQEAYRMALGHYQLIGAMRERVEQARQARRGAQSLLLPVVYNQTVLTRNFTSAELEFEGQRLKLLPAYDYNIAFVISQPVFSGQRNVNTKKQADIGVDVAGKSYVTVAQESLLDVARAYYLVLAIQENIDITRRSVDVTEETLRTAESLFRAGESVETAVLRARVAHTDAQRELLEARNNFQIAKDQLSILMGIKGTYEVSRPDQPRRPSESLDDLIKMGFQNRPELQGLTLQREIADLQIKRQRGQYFPDIRVEGTFVKRRSDFPSNTLSSVAVNANWTLFDGFRRASEVAEAKSQMREVDLQRDLLFEQIEQQVRAAYLDIETQAASVDMLAQQVEFARKNADSTQKAFRVGEATDLDILASNETLTRSERQFALATYELELAIYELERATGTFARDLIPEAPGGKE